MMTKGQFNVRLTVPLRDAARKVADSFAYSRDDVVEAALRAMFGNYDDVDGAKWRAMRKYAGKFCTPPAIDRVISIN